MSPCFTSFVLKTKYVTVSFSFETVKWKLLFMLYRVCDRNRKMPGNLRQSVAYQLLFTPQCVKLKQKLNSGCSLYL